MAERTRRNWSSEEVQQRRYAYQQAGRPNRVHFAEQIFGKGTVESSRSVAAIGSKLNRLYGPSARLLSQGTSKGSRIFEITLTPSLLHSQSPAFVTLRSKLLVALSPSFSSFVGSSQVRKTLRFSNLDTSLEARCRSKTT